MKVIILLTAKREFDQAVAFYENQIKGLGDLFSKEVTESINLISRYPDGFTFISISKLTRKCLLRKFPYMILYGIIDQTIVVSAIAHQHRQPESYLK